MSRFVEPPMLMKRNDSNLQSHAQPYFTPLVFGTLCTCATKHEWFGALFIYLAKHKIEVKLLPVGVGF